MNFIPQFSIDISNAFWFSRLFWMSNLIILKLYPEHYKKRVLKIPRLNGGLQKVVSIFNFILFQGLIILVLFMPLQFDTTYFIIGLLVFFLSFFGYLFALINYATNNPDKPVTKGIYKISRNPQQITTIFMWMGIGLMTNCFFVIALCILQFITVYPTFKAQETFCIEKYGIDFQEYMNQAPRYFLFL